MVEWERCFIRGTTAFFSFSTTLTFWPSLSHLTLEVSLYLNVTGLIHTTVNTSLGERESDKEKKNKVSSEFIALQMSGK